MLNRINTTKNRLVDIVTAKERLRAIMTRKQPQQKTTELYTGIKEYIQRKELARF